MVLAAAEDVLELAVTRVDNEANNLLTKISETAEYTFAYTFDSSLTTSDDAEGGGWYIEGPYDMIVSLTGGCGHTWNNANDLCSNT